jgi:CBS domain-containing protein
MKEAADLMLQNNIRRLPVLNNKGKSVGIILQKIYLSRLWK